jgi:hypothetical protein
LRLPRIGRDIDRPEDLHAFMQARDARHTRMWRELCEKDEYSGLIAS